MSTLQHGGFSVEPNKWTVSTGGPENLQINIFT